MRWVVGGGGRARVRGKVDIERRIVRRNGRLRRGGGMMGLFLPIVLKKVGKEVR